MSEHLEGYSQFDYTPFDSDSNILYIIEGVSK